MAIFGGEIPAAPINDVALALESPFVHERGRVVEYGDEGDRLRLIASPISVAGEALPTRRSPGLGADTEAVLRTLGYSEERVQALRTERVI